jgi:flavin-dependent dehydrogenase
VAALERLGVSAARLDGRPIAGIRYRCARPRIDVEASFPPGFEGLGVRRTRLHDTLAEVAATEGVALRWSCRVDGLTTNGVRIPGGTLRSRWIVGADGVQSRVRWWAGMGAGSSHRRRFGIRRHYRITPWSDRVEIWWGEACEAYVTPIAADEIGVALLWRETTPGARADFDCLMGRFPELQRRLHGAESRSDDRGAGPFEQRVKEVARGYLALIGDAAGYVDAITGEGLGIALQEAEALANALSAGDLSGYPAASAAIRRQPERLTRLLLYAERHPAVRDEFLERLQQRPDLFERLLAVHCGARPLTSLGVSGLLRLASLPLVSLRVQ